MNKYQNALKYVAYMNHDLCLRHGVFAVIAGGAARDTDNQLPFKDIDIFVVYDTENAELTDRVQTFFDNYPDMRYIGEHDPDNPYEENLNRIEGVEDYQLRSNNEVFSVQIIHQNITEGVDPLRQIVDSFDLNICQIGFKFDGERYKYIKSAGYKEDKNNSNVSLTPFGRSLPTEARRIKTGVRAERIARKLNFVQNLLFDNDRRRLQNLLVPGWSPVFNQVMRAG